MEEVEEVENPIRDNIKHPTKIKNLELARSSSTAPGEQGLRNAAANRGAIFSLLLISSDVPSQGNCVDLPG